MQPLQGIVKAEYAKDKSRNISMKDSRFTMQRRANLHEHVEVGNHHVHDFRLPASVRALRCCTA